MSIKARVCGLVDIGVRNEKNDDRLMIGTSIISNGVYAQEFCGPFHCVLCDGVGGDNGGDKAAEFVLNQLAVSLVDDINTDKRVEKCLMDVNEKLLEYQKQESAYSFMKTTIVGVGFYEDKVICYNSGDSRLYRLRNGILFQLSEDHSVAQEMVMGGMITENIEEELMKCSRITRCLGLSDVLAPYVNQINVCALKNDIYLLCSDGLWGTVRNIVIEDVLKSDLTIEDKVKKLYEIAVKNGSDDNISLAVISIE